MENIRAFVARGSSLLQQPTSAGATDSAGEPRSGQIEANARAIALLARAV
jgi:hypothetical protein